MQAIFTNADSQSEGVTIVRSGMSENHFFFCFHITRVKSTLDSG